MKTIEEVAFNRYKSDQSLPKHKQMHASDYIDWAELGAREAQRWIPIEEELPEENITVLAKGGIAIWISAMSKGRLIGYKFSSPGVTESFDATHWRPIERK